jgi:hypothetical protein
LRQRSGRAANDCVSSSGAYVQSADNRFCNEQMTPPGRRVLLFQRPCFATLPIWNGIPVPSRATEQGRGVWAQTPDGTGYTALHGHGRFDRPSNSS